MKRFLSFEDKIRMNALIQGGVDREGYRAWYVELSRPEQSTLAQYLFNVYVCEQHYSEGFAIFEQAVNRTGMKLDDPLVRRFLSVIRGYEPGQGFTEASSPPEEWLNALEEKEHEAVFEVCVYCFGIHEGQRSETCAGMCEHWWHRNLKDPSVVHELLARRRP